MEAENKATVASFLTLGAKGRTEEAFSKYVGAGFKHHNPFFAGSADALKKALRDNFDQNPNKALEIKKVVAEGNLVAVRSHVKMRPDDLGNVITHFFRFENGLIVEMWDSAQPVPAKPLNENGMF